MHGTYHDKVTYQHTDAPLHTDISFDEMSNKEPLQVGCVSQFGLDYVNSVCFGCVRRMLLYWKGPVGPLCVRLGRRDVDILSRKLLALCPHIPSDFVR